MEGRTVIAPLFSLIGGSGIHKPLLLTIIERSGTEPLRFVEDLLCEKFSRLWLELSMQFGLLPEVHGQNLLLALSPDLTPLGRFLYRDFDGLLVDWRLRRVRGLLDPRNMPYAWSWYESYGALLAGAPYVELAWWKLKVSLYAYLYFLEEELSQCMQKWHVTGLIGGPKFQDGDLTRIFSRHMMKAVEVLFGVRVRPEYNIYGSLNKFMMVLLQIRKELIAGKPRLLP